MLRKLACLLLLLAPASVIAQQTRVELTPYGGYRFDGDFSVTGDIFNTDLEVDDDFSYGLLLDIPLNSSLQIELLTNRQDTTLIQRGGLFGNDFRVADIEISQLHVGLLGQFGSGQVRPFVVGSLGVARVDVQLPGLQSDDRLAASLGGGVKIFVSDHFGFRFEGRYYYVDLDENNRRHRDDDWDYWDEQDHLTQAEASFGLILAW
jgi:hypothetical protein